MAVQPDGKIVVVGETTATGTTMVALARYNANGTLDTTFGSGGKVVTTLRAINPTVGVALQTQLDGTFKIVLGGQTLVTVGSTNEYPLFVARYNANGTVDSGFGTGGQTTTLIGLNDHFGGVAVQADGKIVVAGSNGSPLSPNAFYVVRYTTNGNPDAGFGSAGNGALVVPMPAGYTGGPAHGVAVQADGQILVGGQLADPSHFTHFSLLRVNGDASPNGPAGTVDTGYGAAGWAVNPVVEHMDFDQAFTIEPDGKAVAAGYAERSASATYPVDLVLLRFLPSAPQVGAFTASPNPVTAGGAVTLTASNITDGNPNSTVTQVAFYVDSNGDGKLDAGDALLGYGTQSNGVWTLNFSTTGWASGVYTLFAQAQDSYGAFGDPFALTLQVA